MGVCFQFTWSGKASETIGAREISNTRKGKRTAKHKSSQAGGSGVHAEQGEV